MADISIYQVSSSQYPHLISLLLPHLPSSIVLIRHLQWQHQSPTSKIFTTFALTDSSGTHITTLPRIFATARLDRSAFQGLALYIHSCLEFTTLSPFSPTDTEAATRALLHLCSHLHQTNTPSSSADTDLLFVGHLHATTAQILHDHSLISALNSGGPYNKYVIRYTSSSSLPPLPSGLQYTTITPADYALVMQENKLIRNVKTFDDVPTAAIRLSDAAAFTRYHSHLSNITDNDTNLHTGQLIAWAIITSYGSIRTLHVQPAFRGLGLARKVVLRLVENQWPAEFVGRQGMEKDESVVFHTDIDPENQASIRTFAPVGEVLEVSSRYWIAVDLAGAQKALKRL